MVFSGILDIDELLDTVMQKAEEVMEAEASSVFRIGEKRKDLYFITARGEKGKEAKEIRVPMGKGIVGWVAKHGKPLLVPDVRKDPRWFRGVDEKTKWVTRSILAVPLIVKGKVIGVAEVLNKKGNRKFDEADLELFAALGNQIAVAVENASLYTDLDRLFLSSIRAIVEAVDAKDPYTRGHSSRVVNYALQIGRALTRSKDKLKEIEISAILHDVGKIHVPAGILNKPTSLSDAEFALVRDHVVVGYDILRTIDFPWQVAEIVLQHHERLDGSGYPRGAKGQEIMLEARILAVADVVESMMSHRPYRPALGKKKAIEELVANKKRFYDSQIVGVCIKLLNDRKFRFKEGA